MTRRITIILLVSMIFASCTVQNPLTTSSMPESAIPAQGFLPGSTDSRNEVNAPATTVREQSQAHPSSPAGLIQNQSLPAQESQGNAAPTPQPPGLPSGRVQTGVTRFVVQSGTPLGIPDFIHINTPCRWSGVGGQVFDRNDFPIIGLLVEISGSLGGNRIGQLALTGGSTAFGPGGYEIKLADRPVASQGTLNLRLLDLAGKPISDPIPFDTYAECERSLVLINLVEVPAIAYHYFPFLPQTIQKKQYFPLFMQRARPVR